MPLSKGTSQKAFVKNLKTEMEHGKPQKQSLAIAYAMKRKAQKAKKMAAGGEMTEQEATPNTAPNLPGAQSFQDAFRKSTKYAEGGMIEDNYQDPSWRTHQTKDGDVNHHEMDSGYMRHEGNVQRPDEMAMMEDDKRLNQHPVDMHAETSMSEQDLVDRIMELRSKTFESEARNYSEGGKVANSDEIEAGFDPNEFDVLHLDDDLESTYGEDDNAGDALGNAREDEDRKDIVARIMASRRKKDRLPNPR